MLLEELKDFSGQTSIHGIGQIANDRAPVIKRMIWFAIFVGSLAYAGQQLASTIKVWIDKPVIDILDSASFPIEEVEFPTVTLCPKSTNSDRLGPMIKAFDYLPSFKHMKNSAERDLFQALNIEVDKYLRKEAEKNNEFAPPHSKWAIDAATKLAMNETNGKIILDKMWKEYGSFEAFHHYFGNWDSFAEKIKKKVGSIDGSCLPSCNSSVERYLRSLYALYNVRDTFPTSPGSYLAYHFTRFFGKGSYIGFNSNEDGDFWPVLPFRKRPNELTSTFNKYLVDITTQLSDENLNDVSIMDLPNFGSMIVHHDTIYIPWSNQLNMAIYNHLMVINNKPWSKWGNYIYWEAMHLKALWSKYLSDPTTNNYPSLIRNNTIYNYTSIIKKDMTTFLVAYASSIKINTPKISKHWIRAANRSFDKIVLRDPRSNYYDKLIMGCTFKEPLMKHRADFVHGCELFDHTLTTNGLCHTFSGIETSHLLKQKWKTTEINMAFEKVFGNISRPKMTFRGIGHSEGLNIVVDMKPHINIESASTSYLPYTIKISTRNNMIDQKRGLVELRPGYHVVIRILPKVVEMTKEFEAFDTKTRKCKLTHEGHKLKFLKNYTKTGCEFECALKRAMSICKCLPWFYPNDFTEVPMCDMFAARCFDDIMSNDKDYKGCKDDCLENCIGTSYVTIPSYIPLNIAETCEQKVFKDIFRNLIHYTYKQVMMLEHLTSGKWRLPDGSFDPWDDKGRNQFCQEYVKNYISIVSIETPTDTVTKSTRVKRVSFNDQLAVIGGTLGLFSGMSLLSMVEIICFCLTMAKSVPQAGKVKLRKKKSSEDVEAYNPEKDEIETYVKAFVAETIKKACKSNREQKSQLSGHELGKIG